MDPAVQQATQKNHIAAFFDSFKTFPQEISSAFKQHPLKSSVITLFGGWIVYAPAGVAAASATGLLVMIPKMLKEKNFKDIFKSLVILGGLGIGFPYDIATSTSERKEAYQRAAETALQQVLAGQKEGHDSERYLQPSVWTWWSQTEKTVSVDAKIIDKQGEYFTVGFDDGSKRAFHRASPLPPPPKGFESNVAEIKTFQKDGDYLSVTATDGTVMRFHIALPPQRPPQGYENGVTELSPLQPTPH